MNMIEKVARAICEAQNVDPEHPCGGLGILVPKGETWPAWRVRIPQAKAAIEAMMEPTKEMAFAGTDKIMADPMNIDSRVPYQAMIKAALEEE